MLPSRPRFVGHLVAIAAGLVLIGLITLLPDLAQLDAGSDAVTAFRGRIESILPAPADPDAPPVPGAMVLMLDGPQSGQTIQAYLIGPGGSQVVADYRPGDEVVVTTTQTPDASEPFVAVSDRWRLPYLEWLGLFFAAVVVVVGGWRGARALVALGLTIAFIMKILLPLVINGTAPLPLAVLSASAVTVATILLTEGWQRSSVAAILGTTGALALTGLLGALVTGVMGFSYTSGSDLAFVTTQGGAGLDLRGLLLAAFILGTVGVLDDVTVTQAVLVDELGNQRMLRGRALFASAMSVGRSHIGATINTLFLAYVGAGLPLLVLLLVSRQPPALVLNAEAISTEIVRTLVGSIGIVAAVPFTTFVATLLVATGAQAHEPAARRRVAIFALGATIAGLLLAIMLLPLTSGPTTPLPPLVLDPEASLPVRSPAASGVPTDTPAGPTAPSPTDDLVLASRGERLPLIQDGEYVGTVTVADWSLTPSSASGGREVFRAQLRFEAAGALDPVAGAWELLLSDGTEIALRSRGSPSQEGDLAAGETREVTLEGELDTPSSPPFLVYVDEATATIAYALLIE